MNCLKIEWSRNVLFAASRDYAANMMPHLRLYGNISPYSQGRVYNPTNLFSHVAPSIELMMQI